MVISTLFSCDYDHNERYGEMLSKCEFWRDGYWAFITAKNDGFWLLWGIFKEYNKRNIIMAALREAHSHSDVICRLLKKINKVPSASEVLIRRDVMQCISKNSFYTKRDWNKKVILME